MSPLRPLEISVWGASNTVTLWQRQRQRRVWQCQSQWASVIYGLFRSSFPRVHSCLPSSGRQRAKSFLSARWCSNLSSLRKVKSVSESKGNSFLSLWSAFCILCFSVIEKKKKKKGILFSQELRLNGSNWRRGKITALLQDSHMSVSGGKEKLLSTRLRALPYSTFCICLIWQI